MLLLEDIKTGAHVMYFVRIEQVRGTSVSKSPFRCIEVIKLDGTIYSMFDEKHGDDAYPVLPNGDRIIAIRHSHFDPNAQ